MLFNSMAFVYFLLVIFALYWAIPHRYRWLLIVAASYYFYMSWNAKYVALIFFTTIVSYCAARLLEREQSKKKRKWILFGTAVMCLGVLFFFKYFNFISESIASLLSLFTIHMNPFTLNLLLPVGISFYTFQTLSYVIDVYRGDITAEHHFGYYAAFISFFPQLVAGPIERTSNLLPQIKAEHKFNYREATYGLKQMAWGFFKKIVIADTLSPYVSKVYGAPQKYGSSGATLLLATLFFTFEIYCDFSGYSDIAIGTSKLLGIKLMPNFKNPYFSKSIKEFWNRWHISLSTWFRDYVYIPLGGNRVGKFRHALNLMITFLVSGLWHGANWTFVVWGGIHGAAQVIENALLPPPSSENHRKNNVVCEWVKTIFVFSFCAFSWIFFVSNSLGDSMYVITHLFNGFHLPIHYLHTGISTLGLSGIFSGNIDSLRIVLSLLLLEVFDYFSLSGDVIARISSLKTPIRWSIYIVFVFWLYLNMPALSTTEFIYFQF